MAVAAIHAGRSDTAIAAIRAAVAVLGAAPAATALRLRRLAMAEWDRGAFADALGHLDRAAELADADDALDGRLLVLTRQVAGEAQVAALDRAGALRTAAEIDDGVSPYCRAVAARLRGLVAGGDGHAGSAAEWLAEATAGFDPVAMPFDAAVCRLDWAEAVGATDADAAAAAAERSVAAVLERITYAK